MTACVKSFSSEPSRSVNFCYIYIYIYIYISLCIANWRIFPNPVTYFRFQISEVLRFLTACINYIIIMRYKVAYYIAMQLKPVRNTELHNYIIHQPVTVIAQACTCSQTHVKMKHSLAHLQHLIPTLVGIKHI